MGTITAAQLGNIALGTDNHPKGASPKLESVGEDVNERFSGWLLFASIYPAS